MFSISGAVGLSAIVAIAAGAVLCVVGLLLEGIVLVGLPGSGGLAIGLLVGIITFGGVATNRHSPSSAHDRSEYCCRRIENCAALARALYFSRLSRSFAGSTIDFINATPYRPSSLEVPIAVAAAGRTSCNLWSGRRSPVLARSWQEHQTKDGSRHASLMAESPFLDPAGGIRF